MIGRKKMQKINYMCSSKCRMLQVPRVGNTSQPSASFTPGRIRPPYAGNDWEYLLPTPRAIQAYTVQKETKNEREKDRKVRTQSHRQQNAQISNRLNQQTSPIPLNTKKGKTLGATALSTYFCIRPYASLSGEQKCDHRPPAPFL